MSRVVMSGYYGFNNAGDESILYSIIETLRKIDPDLEITVLSHDPEKTAKRYHVQAVNRWRILEIIKALRKSDLLLSGGGSLLQDVSSANSPLYYLGIMLLSLLMGKPYMIYAQGIGPLNISRNRKLTAWLANHARTITVRDEGSKKELESYGVKKPIVVTADPVLGLKGEDISRELGQKILERNNVKVEEEERLLGVFIRSWQGNDFLPELAQACDILSKEGWKIVFVPMHFPEDIVVAKETAKLMTEEAVVLKEKYSPQGIISLIKHFKLLIGMRLHSLIGGAVAGVPVVGLSYDPKVDRFLEQIGHQSLISVNSMKASVLLEMVNWSCEHQEEVTEKTKVKLEPLYQKAWKNARLVEELLGKIPPGQDENKDKI